jgi:hypothetical protein
MLFVSEFALENARNAVLELQKCKHLGGGPPDPPFLWKLSISMTVEINQKELYYNYYTSGKFLTFKFQVKSSATLLPTSHASLCP